MADAANANVRGLAGVCAAVTGGTKGIGRAVVRTLAAAGARVAFQGRDAAAARDLLRDCAGLAGEALYVPGDVTSFADACTLVEQVRAAWGRIDVYVSSGGPREPAPRLFADLATPADSMAMIASRLGPRLNGLHAAVPAMRAQGGGKIILLTTDAAREPTPSESMVGAAGAVVMFLARALAKELAASGIRVNAVATTITSDTPPYERYLEARRTDPGNVLVKAFDKAHAKAAFRVNTPRDIADYVAFLASPAADQISGSTLSINGGLSFPSY